MIISLLIMLEFFLLMTSIYLIIREKGESIAKSFSYASIVTLSIYSVLIQVFFLIKAHTFFPLVDVTVISFSIFQLFKDRGILKKDTSLLFRFVWERKILAFLVIPVMIYLFLQVLLVPPGNSDSLIYNLARVLIFMREGTMFPMNYSAFHQVAFPLGTDVLSFLFLRFGTDFGIGLFSFVSYIVVIVGTYSLVSRMYQKKTAILVSIVIASLTGLVLQATTTKNDIPCSAAVVVIFLAGYEFLSNRKSLDLYMILTAILWGLMVKGYFAAFVLPFVLFYVVLLWKGKLFSGVREVLSVSSFKEYPLLILPLAMILCLSFLYGNNLDRFGNLWGDEAQVSRHQNKDGVLGTVANIARYVAQSAEIPMKYGYRLNQIHDRLLKDRRTAGCRNEREIVDLAEKPFVSEDYSWYGVLGFFLIIPGIGFSLFRGNAYTKLVAWTLLVYFGIVSYRVAWMPWNGRFFSLAFAGAGCCVAFILNRFAANKFRLFRGMIIIVAIFSILSATLQNDQKPSIPKYKSVNLFYNIYRWGKGALEGRPKRLFNWWDEVGDRYSHYKKYYPPGMLDVFMNRIETRKRVLVLTNFAPVFPLLFLRPDVDITISGFSRVSIDGKWYYFDNLEDFKAISGKYDFLVFLNRDIKKSALTLYPGSNDSMFYSEVGSISRFRK